MLHHISDASPHAAMSFCFIRIPMNKDQPDKPGLHRL